MVHWPPGERLLWHVLVDVKSPLATMLEIVSVELSLLVRVADNPLLAGIKMVPRFKGLGERVMPVPVPLRLTICGLLGSLSLMVRVPVLFPAAVGLKVTVTKHCLPAPRLDLQLLEVT